jgi:hypothetical protein
MRAPIPVRPEKPARHDYEYERNGTANLRDAYLTALEKIALEAIGGPDGPIRVLAILL